MTHKSQHTLAIFFVTMMTRSSFVMIITFIMMIIAPAVTANVNVHSVLPQELTFPPVLFDDYDDDRADNIDDDDDRTDNIRADNRHTNNIDDANRTDNIRANNFRADDANRTGNIRDDDHRTNNITNINNNNNAVNDNNATDGIGLIISVDQTIFDRSYTGSNIIEYNATFGALSFEQTIRHDLRRDRIGNIRQHVNAAGSAEGFFAERTNVVTLGVDWVPVMQYSNDRGGRNSLVKLDAGPTARASVWSVPVLLRAGLSARRLDSLSSAGDVHAAHGAYGERQSAGAYGAISVGAFDEPIRENVPIYFAADAVGRHIENSSMASLAGEMLGARRVGAADSVFVYGRVTIFNGREGYLEHSADSRVAHFVETPWRVERNAGAMVGYRGGQKLIFFPELFYGVNENALEFRGDDRLRDERTVRQTLAGSLSTDTSAGIFYSGSLTFEWRDHDRLFGAPQQTRATASNIDSLNTNLWDYASFDPRTAHRLALRLPQSFRIQYDFSANRFLTEYPNFYEDERGARVINNDDSDRRTLHHRLALIRGEGGAFRAEIFGEAIQYDLVFLRQTKSGSNRTDNTHRAGARVEWEISDDLVITESITAEAKRGSFHFPQFHQGALSRPRYSRTFGNTVAAEWRASQTVGVNAEWSVTFSDYGFWYGREYMTSELAQNPQARVDFYAITGKSAYHTFDASARLSLGARGASEITAGCAAAFAQDRHYESGNYIISNADGVTVKPYLAAMFAASERLAIAARVSHTFVGGGLVQNFWDMRLQAEGSF